VLETDGGTVIPETLRTFCALCSHETAGVTAMADHLEQAHDATVERWPDGEPVVDMSHVPELLEEQ
jgi:hypothetical protein